MRVLVILSRLPYQLDKGDKLRAFHQIKQLSKKNEIVLFAIHDSNVDETSIEELKKYCTSITVIRLSKITILFNLIRALFKGIPLQVGYFYFKKAQDKLDLIVDSFKPEHIYCQLIRTSEYAKKYRDVPKTIDYMDVFSKGIERRKATEPFYMRPLFSMEYKRLVKYERAIFECFNNKTIISEQDKNLIGHPEKDKIVVIPNGVDTDYFTPIEVKKEYEILFNGNMNYPPNIESVEFLVNEIMPLVWEKNPHVRVLISGASPNNKVLDLASDKVIVTGWVDDIRASFSKSKVLVAPMQISIGLQNKLLEAMAMKIPCITSTLANNALMAEPDEEILVADSPEQYADYILDLLENEEKAQRIADNAYRYVKANFNWEATVEQLEKLMNKK